MSQRAAAFMTRFYKQRGQPKPLALSAKAATELMEAYWQDLREREHARHLARLNKATEKMIALTKKTKPKEREIPTPKVFLTKFNGRINVAFRIGHQTFTLDMIRDDEMPEKEQANWLANMLRSAFRQERVTPENDSLLSMFNDNEPQEP